MRLAGPLSLLVLLLAGCSSLSVHVEPKADLGSLKNMFIEVSATDNHGVHRMILDDLRSRGFTVHSGPLTLMPLGAQAYIVYKDYWAWDIKSYLVQIDLTLRDARSRNLLATVQYFKPTGLASKPEEIVRKSLDALFKKTRLPPEPNSGGNASSNH